MIRTVEDNICGFYIRLFKISLFGCKSGPRGTNV